MGVRQISISRTDGEWKAIKNRLSQLGNKDLVAHITCESRRIMDTFKECPDCITCAAGNKKEKRPYIPESVYEDMKTISKKMKVPIATAIDKLIIAPLLVPKPSA